ncbi:3'-5' exonuclease [Morganella morganii]|uniref:3'-5' exonuclease n=1 Tax=Morganella morganii TaxID=582 RepID=UPI0011B7F9F1|nr:3'-5' exonuclease [Morganella morganii]QXO42225.1 3'-5' exonuclease [Morganella morganii]QXO45857.1 3'-5' exonuclease [Morganella morganii]QXO49526.1 3'-5' exonuclease [Morganella morganii]QXO53387.1 3'-5' exonuclease [Morganella morganii]QXO80026.1 3'-5' exonuclease [Morganella morganii]
MSKKSQSEARCMAQALLSENIVFLDTETTGLGTDDEIIEISIIGKHGEILLDTLIKPVRSIPESASRIHNITDWDVRGSPAWPEIYQDYRDAVKNKTVIIYNRRFDNRLLRQTCGKYHVATPRIKTICLMELYSLYEGVINRRTGGYKWFKLIDAIENNNIMTIGSFHRALSDVCASRKLLYFIAGKDEYLDINESEEKLVSMFNLFYSKNELKEEQKPLSTERFRGSNNNESTEKNNHKNKKDNLPDGRKSSGISCFGILLFMMSCVTLVIMAMNIFKR